MAQEWVAEQYEDQSHRGQRGFGLTEIDQRGIVKVRRAVEPVKMLVDLRLTKVNNILLHHRSPTSSENSIGQTHPLYVIHDELKYDWLINHNGVIGNTEELRRRIAQYNSTAGIIECIHHPLYFEDVFTGERHNIHTIKGRKVASLSGIAQPESFEQSVVKLGAELVYAKRFADHHRFNQQVILNTINRGKKRQAEIIITTQKDAVRFPKLDRRDLPILFMRVEINIVSGADDFRDCVRRICFR